LHHALLLIGILLISFSAIFVRLAEVTPDTSAFFRSAYALPFLFVLWWRRRSEDQRTPREHRLAFLAGILLGLDLAFWHRSIEKIGAGLATVLGNTQVIFVGAAAWILYGERPRRSALLMVPSVLLGVGLISGLGQLNAYGDAPAYGTFLGLLTGITYAVFLLIMRRANDSPSPPGSAMLNATAGATLTCLVIGTLGGHVQWAITWPAHGWLLALSLGSQVIGWTLISNVLPKLPALEASVLLLLQPVGTVFWGRLFFAEILSTLQWLGVALVVGGVGWLSTRGSVEEQEPGE
jgi:drug/metabolite transporter (DMT)-like permease